jgi:outer membrane protein OmpA-like peptidoglycan-associated protein
VGYADNPLILGIPGSSETAYRLVDDLTFFDISGGIALKDRAEIAVALPMSIARGQKNATLDPSIGNNPLGYAVGDLRLSGKYAFFQKGSALQLATSLRIDFPIGNTATLRSSGAFVFQPRLLGELNLSVFRLLANAGFALRTADERLLNLTVGQEFVWAIGAEVPLYGEANKLSLLLTANGNVGLSQLSAVTVPIDALGGLKYAIADTLAFEVALGGGLTRGYATPRFEAVLGISFLAKPIKTPEQWVKADESAAEPAKKKEGFDMGGPKKEGFDLGGPKKEPEPVVAQAPPPGALAEEKDSDGDGVPDSLDKCPNEKETINGIDDDDGCPDKGEGLVIVTGSTLKLKSRVAFVHNGARLTSGTEALLKQLALTLKARRSLRLRLEVYVTEMKTRNENDALSAVRTQTLRDFLESRGVNPSQLDVRSRGVERPLDVSSVEVSTF